MPVHDWTRVDAGLFHHFHQRWIGSITDVLNDRVLPAEYYALEEQQEGDFVPDVLALKTKLADQPENFAPRLLPSVALLEAPPKVRVSAESELDFYRRKQSVAAVRTASGDQLVAIVEVVSKGNKSGRKAFDDFVRKASEFLARGIHLLILDLQPPTPRDPQGIHGALWDDLTGQEYTRPADKPLTLAAYEGSSILRAYVEPVATGDALINMPLFLEPGSYVEVPCEETYEAAYRAVPRRWRSVLDAE